MIEKNSRVKNDKSKNLDFDAGFNMVLEAVKYPLWNITINSGESPDLIIHKVLEMEDFVGYDARNKKFDNLLTAGIIDPKKVVRCALENSVSAANSLLSIGCSITFDK